MSDEQGSTPYWLTDEGRRWPSDHELDGEPGGNESTSLNTLPASFGLVFVVCILGVLLWHNSTCMPSLATLLVYLLAWLMLPLPVATLLHLAMKMSTRSRLKGQPSIAILTFYVFGIWGVIDGLRFEAAQASMLAGAFVAACSAALWIVVWRLRVPLGPGIEYSNSQETLRGDEASGKHAEAREPDELEAALHRLHGRESVLPNDTLLPGCGFNPFKSPAKLHAATLLDVGSVGTAIQSAVDSSRHANEKVGVAQEAGDSDTAKIAGLRSTEAEKKLPASQYALGVDQIIWVGPGVLLSLAICMMVAAVLITHTGCAGKWLGILLRGPTQAAFSGLPALPSNVDSMK